MKIVQLVTQMETGGAQRVDPLYYLVIPVIVSDIPALREVADTAALYIEPDDPENIAQAIKKVENDPLLAQQMRRDSKKEASRFGLQGMVDAYERLF